MGVQILGGGGAMTLAQLQAILDPVYFGGNVIADVTLGADAALIDLTAIPATWKNLRILAAFRTDSATDDDWVTLSINGDTTNANYGGMAFGGYAATTFYGGGIVRDFAFVAANTAPANVFGVFDGVIPFYADTTRKKVANGRGSLYVSVGGKSIVWISGLRWDNVAAVNQLTFRPKAGANLKAGSRVQLIGEA